MSTQEQVTSSPSIASAPAPAVLNDKPHPLSQSTEIRPEPTDIPLDATLDSTLGIPTLPTLNTNVLPVSLSSSPATWTPASEIPNPMIPQLARLGAKPKKTGSVESLAKVWNIDTSAESSSATSSPTGSNFEMSRQSSMTDLANYATSENEGSGVPAPKKKSHARKQPPGHIKRARNAFILFRKHITDSGLIPPSVEVKHQNISVVAAKMWREAPQDVRAKFQEQARIEKEEHQRLYPGYRYQPVFRRTDIIRRRVRKDAAEDDKVEAVAEALIQGKAGEQLEEEIKEQLIQRTEASESEQEVKPVSRRRRREQGELSKGAQRAERAKNRAKQMRQNLLGTNLLNMSFYNAQREQQMQREQQQRLHSHPGMQYAMEYMPPVEYPVYPEDMYRLPPIMGYEQHPHHQHHQQQPSWDGVDPYYVPEEYYQQQEYEAAYGSGYHQEPGMSYQLPPLHHEGEIPLELPVEHIEEQHQRQHWGGGEAAQTPSGHVVFNERLFDGALSAGLERRDDELGAFDEALRQAEDVSAW